MQRPPAQRAAAAFLPLSAPAEQMLRAAFARMGYSARAYDRILRVARTVADMNGAEVIGPGELMEALQYRQLDREPNA